MGSVVTASVPTVYGLHSAFPLITVIVHLHSSIPRESTHCHEYFACEYIMILSGNQQMLGSCLFS